MSEPPAIPEKDPQRRLRQGDLPVDPDRPLEPPADGMTIFPVDLDVVREPLQGDIEHAPEPDPVRDSVIAEDWPELPD